MKNTMPRWNFVITMRGLLIKSCPRHFVMIKIEYGHYWSPEMEGRKLRPSVQLGRVIYLCTAARANWLFAIIKLDKYAFPVGSKRPF
jgi:hypothetical protein